MKEQNLDEIEKEIDLILDDIKSGGINDNELLKVKNILESSHISKRQSMNYLADRFSFYKLFFGDADKMNSEVFNYLSVGKEDLIKVVEKYLNKESRVVLDYLPNLISEN